jgi:peroxiredoxin
MKNLFFSFFLILPLSLIAGVTVGQQAPDFSLEDASGKTVSLSDFKGKTVVLEWINPGCPFVRKFYNEQDMPAFQEKARKMGVVWLSINSTNPDHRDYMTPEETRAWAKEHGHEVPWLLDTEGTVGKAYGAVTTPHMFVINESGNIVYQGAIDTIRDTKPESVSKATNYVMEALTAMDKGGSFPNAQTRPYGCSVKY